LDFSRLKKPTDKTFVESYNGKFQAKCIVQHWLLSLDDAKSDSEAYRRECNEERPHSAISNRTTDRADDIRRPTQPSSDPGDGKFRIRPVQRWGQLEDAKSSN